MPAGEHEVGVSVSAALAGRRPGCAGVAGPGRRSVPPVACPAGETAGGPGSRACCVGLGLGPAVDPGPDHHADRAAVPRPVHAARYLVSAAPHGVGSVRPGAPGDGARRGGGHRVAGRDLGEGSMLAAATGRRSASRTRRARTCARRRPCSCPPRLHPGGCGVGQGARAGCQSGGPVGLRPGCRGRLFYRMRVHRAQGERRSMSEADYAALITAAHHQLHAPVILIWDNLTAPVP